MLDQTILIVTDDLSLADEIRDILEPHANIMSADNSSDALAAIQQERISSALIDCELSPQLTRQEGEEGLILIGLMTRSHRQDVIALTGVEDKRTMESCLKSGARTVLSKQRLSPCSLLQATGIECTK